MTKPHRLPGKRLKLLAAPFLTIATGLALLSCEDNTPTVGSALATGEVQIAIDSLIWNGTEQTLHRGDTKKPFLCPAISYSTEFDAAVDSRSATNLLGRLSVPEYGDLHCSFVSRMMCATSLPIPDSIPIEQVDSMKLLLTVRRGALTGDSLAPQQLRVFRLTKSLPTDITNRFDPTGYYDPANPIGSCSYTLSALGMSDSLYTHLTYVDIAIPMSKEDAQNTVRAYRSDKTLPTFAWPQTFEEKFHGIYVEPSFGRGCVADISLTNFVIFYSYKEPKTSTTDGITTTTVETKTGLAGVFASSPIVLSSNNINYRPSSLLTGMADEGKAIITTPGGYRVNFRFPGRELVDIYQNSQARLAVVSDLGLSIPVEEIENDYGLTPPPYLIMVKSSKLTEFMASNSLPNYKDSFYAIYDEASKRYTFTDMREYILDLIKNGVKDEDLDFTILPADLTFETNQNTSSSYYNIWSYYASASTSGQSYMTKCGPYISKPTMCRLKMDEARTVFVYSLQQMK